MKKGSKEEKIKIKQFGSSDIFEIGDWIIIYDFIKLGYKNDNLELKYSDISFLLKQGNSVIGYFIVKNIVNVNNDDIIPLYSKKLVLYDFAISTRAYAKYGKILIDYLLNYAKNNGYKAIEITKIDQFNFFNKFIQRNYKVIDFNNKLNIIIDNPVIKASQKHLLIYENENITIEDLYFLYDLKFTLNKTSVKFKLDDNNSIVIDRRSGKIVFPSFVNVIYDDVILNSVTRNIVHYICKEYNDIKGQNVIIDYKSDKPTEFEIYVNNTIYVSKNIQDLLNDFNYALKMYYKKINFIYPCLVEYDMNERSFGLSMVGIKPEKIIEKYCSACDSKAISLQDKLKEMKIANEFNLKLDSLKRFDFRFGNSFCGIKKLLIKFDDELEILSNGTLEKNIIPNSEIIKKELTNFFFSNWKSKYDRNINPVYENSWTISLIFEDEVMEFKGLDDYPKVWEYVIWFINKYSKFTLEEE